MQRDVAVAQLRIGHVQRENKRFDLAANALDESWTISQELAKADPLNNKTQRDQYFDLIAIGELHQEMNQLDKARDSFTAAVAVTEALGKADPQSAQAKRDLAVSYAKLGQTHVMMKQPDKALAVYLKAAELAEGLTKERAESVEQLREAADVFARAGGANQMLGNNADAPIPARLEHYREAKRSYQRSLEVCLSMEKRGILREVDVPILKLLQQYLQECDTEQAYLHNITGDEQRRQDRKDDALASYRESLKLAFAASRANREHPYIHNVIASLYLSIGRLQEAMDKPGDAITTLQEGLTFAKTRADAFPKGLESQRDLGNLHAAIGEIYRMYGRYSEALASYREAQKIREGLAKGHPGNAKVERDQWMSSYHLGLTYRGMGHHEKLPQEQRLAHLREAIPWFGRAHDSLVAIQKRGALAPADGNAIAEMSMHLKACRAAITQFGGVP